MRSKPTRRSTARAGVVLGLSRTLPTSHASSAVSFAASAASRGSLISRLGPSVLESLESRVHLSVSRDVNGFTVITPVADARVIYVSAQGNDGNSGTSPNSAVQSIAQARTLVRNNMPDEILLRRGDVFTTPISNWAFSGRGIDEPFVIGSFNDPARPSTERPKISSGISSGFSNQASSSNHPVLSYISIMGVSFEANNRNYRQPNANFTVNFKADALGGTYGLNILGQVSNLLVENCSFQYYRGGMLIETLSGWGNPSNVKLRRNIVADNYAPSFDATGKYVTSEGLYANSVQGLTLEENLFDHNGWSDPAFGNFGAIPSIYNHNVYANIDNNNLVVTGNIFANAASHGIQVRPGGIVTNNLFLNNPIAMSYGYVNGQEKPGGVSGEISGNVIYGGRDISGQPRGWGLEIGNTRPAASGGGTVVKNNIYTSYAADGQPAIQLTFGTNTTNPEQGVGINDLTIQDNTVFGWTRGLYLNPGFSMGVNGRHSFNNVNILNNEFQQVNATPVVQHGPNFNAAVETWRGNRYDIIGTASGSTPFFTIKGLNKTLGDWQGQVEPTASIPQISYPNPNLSPGSYNAALGGTATVDGFLAEARKSSQVFYRSQYTAVAVENYIKAGFGGQRIDAFPPSAVLTAPSVTAGGGTTETFTVSWNDDNQVNFSSIGTGDVLVTGPNGYSQIGTLLSATPNADGSSVNAVYSVPAANGSWSAAANGTYTISARANEVQDKAGNSTPAATIGTFSVSILTGAPTASLVTTSVVQSTAPAVLTVTYTVSSGGIDASTLDSSDLLVTGSNGFLTTARFESVSPGGNTSPLTAVYKIDPPSGGWTSDANGLYQVAIQAGQVSSTGSVSVGSAVLGSFSVNVNVPTATAVGPVISTATSADQIVTATYKDASGIDATTIGSGDLHIEGPNGFLATVTYVSKTGSGTLASPMVVTYKFAAPAGGFVEAYNGNYFVVLNPGEVKASNGTPASDGVIGTFTAFVDLVGPSGIQATPDIYKPTAAGTLPIIVVYSDPSGIKTSSLGTGDIQVDTLTGPAIPVFQGFTTSGASVTATYILTTPGGFDATKNGFYTVTILSGQVSDNVGNLNTNEFAGQFRVGIDNQPPQITSAVNSILNQFDDATITVYVSDDPGVDTNTLSGSNFRVTGPKGFNSAVDFVSVDAPDGSFAAVVYHLAAPAGGWQPENNGTYSLVLQPNQIADLSGNFAPGAIVTTFNVAVAQTVKATIDPVPSGQALPGLDSMTIHFSENVTGFTTSQLSLTKDGGPELLDGTQTLTQVDSVTYKLTGLAPLTTQAGTYTFKLDASSGAIVGESGAPLSANATLTFVLDTGAPTFVAQTTNITAASNLPAVISVTYSDSSGVNTSTISDGDLIVTGPNGYSQIAKLLTLDNPTSGPTRTATYSVPAPAAGWTSADNGTYAIRTRSNQVADVLGNFIPVTFVGSFNVNITTGPADTAAPTVALTAITPNPRSVAVDTTTITFSEPVSGFDLSDLTLTRSGGSNLLGATQGLTTADNKTYTLNGLTGLTTTVGTYVLTLKSTGTGITDLASNALVGGASTSWSFAAIVASPSISSVTPNPVTGSTVAQNLTITGANFTVGSVVKLRNLTASTTITATISTSTSTQIVVSNVFGTAASSWTAEVLTGSSSSGQVNFSVIAPATLGISANPNPVSGRTAALSVVNGGTDTSTKFAWSATTVPSGATTPTYSANNSNAAKASTVTFSKAGTYVLKLTSTTGTTVKTATISLVVKQTLTSVLVTPATASLAAGGATKQLAASAKDQFGNSLSAQPTFNWTIDSGGIGSVTTAGLYTSPATATGSAKVRATASGSSLSGSSTVTVTSAVPLFSVAKVNFQPSSAATVSGYLVDSGNTYAVRSGQTYGWSVSETSNATDRNLNSSQLFDTNIAIKSGAKWEFAVPSGTYSVLVAVGDGLVSTTNTIRLEGTTVFSAVKQAAKVFSTKTVTVAVSDGKLTLDAGSGADLATRINYIEISKV